MFLLADMMTWCEVAFTLCRKAAAPSVSGGRRSDGFMRAAARIFAAEALAKVHLNGLKVSLGTEETVEGLMKELAALPLGQALNDTIRDMDLLAAELVA